MLRGVAGRLRAALRPSDLLARIGGEEFLVALPGAGEEEAATVAERLRQRGVAFSALRLEHGRLDEVFRRITAEAPP